MALIHCNNCHTTRDCKLNPENDKVVCMECGEVVENVSPFFVNTMKSKKEYIDKKKQPFKFPCEKCETEMKGVLSKNESQVLCIKCNTPMKVSFYMIQAMKSIQGGSGLDIDDKDVNKKLEAIKSRQTKTAEADDAKVETAVSVDDNTEDGTMTVGENIEQNGGSADLDSRVEIVDSGMIENPTTVNDAVN